MSLHAVRIFLCVVRLQRLISMAIGVGQEGIGVKVSDSAVTGSAHFVAFAWMHSVVRDFVRSSLTGRFSCSWGPGVCSPSHALQ